METPKHFSFSWAMAGPDRRAALPIAMVTAAARVAVLTVGLLYAGLLVATGSFSPFLYYQF